MTPIDFMALAQQCAPQVAPATLAALVRTESGFNPDAIGVVHGQLVRQPRSAAEAIATAQSLERGGWNYSVGLAQVNRSNFTKYGLTLDHAFDPCLNLTTGAAILQRCYQAARHVKDQVQPALHASLSCYASGNFVTGYRVGYVQRVVANAGLQPLETVPAIEPRVMPIPVVPLDQADGSDGRFSTTGDKLNPRSYDPGREERDKPSDDSAVVF